MFCLCGREVVSVGTPPVLLDPDPDPLGIYGPDGSKLTLREIVAAGSAHRGWRRHACPAADVDLSETLFGAVE